jgi:predicted TIM-barrel fold metal-dependent hydrolase
LIDVHAHLGHKDVFSTEFLDGIRRSVCAALPPADRTLAVEQTLRRIVDARMRDASGDGLVRAMDDAGVEQAVLLIIDFFHGQEGGEERLALIHTMHGALVRRHKGRLRAFAGVDPRRGDAGVAFLRRALTEHGCRGLKLYPPCGFELDDARLWPLFALCREHGVPVLTHTGPSLPTMAVEERFPGSLAAAAKAFPEVDFILAHALLGAFNTHLELARALPNVHLEISGFQTEGFGGSHLAARLGACFDTIPRQVMYGSDWPLFNFQISPKRWLEHLARLREGTRVDDERWEFFAQRNAARVLR